MKNLNLTFFLHNVLYFLILIFILPACNRTDKSSDTEQVLLREALPVWAEGREKEMNLTLGFRGNFMAKGSRNYKLSITASTLYRAYLNGEFLGYGPARAGHDYYRVDEYDLTTGIIKGENILAIEVAGYNINSYYTLDQPSFLLAEVTSGNDVVLATGSENDFSAFQIRERLQRVERYSFQRPFTEYYRLNESYDHWKRSKHIPGEILQTAVFSPVKILPRNVLLPDFTIARPVSVYSSGTMKHIIPEKYRKDRSLTRISEKLKGYTEDELEVIPSLTIQELVTDKMDISFQAYSKGEELSVTSNTFCTLDFGVNLTGFIGSRVRCTEPSTLFFYFDEILTDDDVKPKTRMPDVNNLVVYELEPGVYDLESFEPYTFKYLKIIVLNGSCVIEDIYLRNYAYPENTNAFFTSSNIKLNEIYNAARQTFRQNALDILMDCPSRERAGWLCDSYFSAIMEKDFTGSSDVTCNFLENYALPDSFSHLPEGMIPMCYPADHYNGVFIPNWSLWFILQVHDYAERSGDTALIALLKPKVEGVLQYFSRFENEDGLLENLESWIFVEWSKANDFVLDVNYPTNMLYSKALLLAAELYNNDCWYEKAEHVKQKILEQSFNGTFFIDNAIRNRNKELDVTSNITEVCQYYAFYFKIATPETHPDLWKRLISDFGPHRDINKTYPDVFPANAFVGNYMRMDILSEYGLQNQLLNEIQEYFYYMAQRTGTLWEKMEDRASCNHGFASYLGHVLYRDILGIYKIDYADKKVTINFSDIDLDECSGAIPVGNEVISLKWKKADDNLIYSVNLPSEYDKTVVNHSHLKLVEEQW